MAIKAKITNENDNGLNAELSFIADKQERIIQIDIRFQNSPDRDDNGKYQDQEPPRYEMLTATLDEIIWLRDAINESIREVVGL